MSPAQRATTPVLRVRRIFPVPRARVFRAWTDPRELRKWWHFGPGSTTEIATVDLRVGGEFRLSIRPAGSDHLHTVRGIFREVARPRKLVYTWTIEGVQPAEETLVTVEFLAHDGATEVIVTHELFVSTQSQKQADSGWHVMLTQLARYVVPRPRRRNSKPHG